MKLSPLAALAALAACHADAPAASRIDPGAVPLLDAWANAVGGRERLAALHAVHARGTMTQDGRAAAFESWWTDRGERKADSDDDGVIRRAVFDGRRGWAADPSGLVIELDGAALDVERTGAYLASDSALVQGRLPGAVELVDDHTLRLTAEGSTSSITVELDPVTHLPLRTRQVDDGTEEVVELSDWRDVDGVRFAFRARTTGQDVSVNDIASIDHDTTTFAPLVDRSDDVRFTQPSPIELPLQVADSSELQVRLSVNGSSPVSLVLDSGAPLLLDPARLPGVALHTTGASRLVGENGSGDMAFATGVTLSTPGLVLGPYTPGTASIGANYPDLDRAVAGIAGSELFERVVVEIDYANHRVRLYDRGTYHHAGGGTPLHFVWAERSPVVEATLQLADGVTATGPFIVDTGCACDVVVTAPFASAHPVRDMLRARVSGAAFDAGTIDGVVIGATRVSAPSIGVSRAATGLFANRDLAGFIGGNLLRHFRVTFDYASHAIWLDPP